MDRMEHGRPRQWFWFVVVFTFSVLSFYTVVWSSLSMQVSQVPPNSFLAETFTTPPSPTAHPTLSALHTPTTAHPTLSASEFILSTEKATELAKLVTQQRTKQSTQPPKRVTQQPTKPPQPTQQATQPPQKTTQSTKQATLVPSTPPSASQSSSPTTPSQEPPFRHVFVTGVHSSGASLLHYALAGHPQVAMLEGGPGSRDSQNEGQFMQGVFSTDDALAKMKNSEFSRRLFAFSHIKAHQIPGTEQCTPEKQEQLRTQWNAKWDVSKSVLVEKSPPNIMRSQCLHDTFEKSLFVLVVRHPLLVCRRLITKDVPGYMRNADLFDCVRHWLAAYRTAERDFEKSGAEHVVVFEEDFVRSPKEHLGELLATLELHTPVEEMQWMELGTPQGWMAVNRPEGFVGDVNHMAINASEVYPSVPSGTTDWDLRETRRAFSHQLHRFGYLLEEPWRVSSEQCSPEQRISFGCP